MCYPPHLTPLIPNKVYLFLSGFSTPRFISPFSSISPSLVSAHLILSHSFLLSLTLYYLYHGLSHAASFQQTYLYLSVPSSLILSSSSSISCCLVSTNLSLSQCPIQSYLIFIKLYLIISRFNKPISISVSHPVLSYLHQALSHAASFQQTFLYLSVPSSLILSSSSSISSCLVSTNLSLSQCPIQSYLIFIKLYLILSRFNKPVSISVSHPVLSYFHQALSHPVSFQQTYLYLSVPSSLILSSSSSISSCLVSTNLSLSQCPIQSYLIFIKLYLILSHFNKPISISVSHPVLSYFHQALSHPVSFQQTYLYLSVSFSLILSSSSFISSCLVSTNLSLSQCPIQSYLIFIKLYLILSRFNKPISISVSHPVLSYLHQALSHPVSFQQTYLYLSVPSSLILSSSSSISSCLVSTNLSLSQCLIQSYLIFIKLYLILSRFNKPISISVSHPVLSYLHQALSHPVSFQQTYLYLSVSSSLILSSSSSISSCLVSTNLSLSQCPIQSYLIFIKLYLILSRFNKPISISVSHSVLSYLHQALSHPVSFQQTYLYLSVPSSLILSSSSSISSCLVSTNLSLSQCLIQSYLIFIKLYLILSRFNKPISISVSHPVLSYLHQALSHPVSFQQTYLYLSVSFSLILSSSSSISSCLVSTNLSLSQCPIQSYLIFIKLYLILSRFNKLISISVSHSVLSYLHQALSHAASFQQTYLYLSVPSSLSYLHQALSHHISFQQTYLYLSVPSSLILSSSSSISSCLVSTNLSLSQCPIQSYLIFIKLYLIISRFTTPYLITPSPIHSKPILFRIYLVLS